MSKTKNMPVIASVKKCRRTCVLLLSLLLWVGGLHAQNNTSCVKPATSTEGYDFYVTWLPNGASKPEDKDLKLQLLVSSREANKVCVEFFNGAKREYNVPAGGTTPIDVDAKQVYWDLAKDEDEKILDKGVRVYSVNKKPMTVYATNQIGEAGTYSFDASHVLPKEALGYEYMVQTAQNDAVATELVVMSTRPGRTTVNIDLAVKSRKGKEQITINFTKAKQIYIVRSKSAEPELPNDLIDLSGSLICSDAPIAVWSGNHYAIIPNKDGFSTDHAVDQLLPLPKWGKEFIVPMMGLNMQMNEVHIVSSDDNTNVTLNGLRRGQPYTLNKTMMRAEKWKKVVTAPLGGNLLDSILTVKADKPIQVYLYSSSAANNPYDDINGVRHMQGDPSMTMISPLEFLTDTTIFSTYEAGDKQSTHQLVLWAKKNILGSIQLDGNFIGAQFTNQVSSMPDYRYARIDLNPGTHTIVSAERGFGGYVYGVNDGQAYLYPSGYTFLPYQDSLFLNDPNHEFPVFRSEWNEKYLNNGGWYLDRDIQLDDKVVLDSIRVCDSTELTFPVKMYNKWDHVKWEILGSIQKTNYFAPVIQYATDTDKPELTHQFTLLPIEKNKLPFEDFEVRAVVYHRPMICDDSNPEKWPKDTLNTTVRVLRAYNDTTWKAICMGEEYTFFSDTTATGERYETTFNAETNDVPNGMYKYQLGENIITRHYVSVGGCDSLSTLRLFVCQSYEEDKHISICADDLYKIESENQLGEYFKNMNFVQSYERKDSKYWAQQADGTWLFTGSSTLKAKGCINSLDFEPYVGKVGNFSGCDSILNLELVVIPVNEYVTSIFQCEEVYNWKDENGNLITTITYDPTKHEKNKQYQFDKKFVYTSCPECPAAGCDSVRHTLFITFVDSEGIKKEIHVCQGETSRYEVDGHVWTFDSKDKICNTPYVQPAVKFTTQDGNCQYDYIVTFVVDSMYNYQADTLVYCWDKGDKFTYEWTNHTNFTVIEPNNRTYQLGEDENQVVLSKAGTYILRDELTTVSHCDSIWTQVIILQPTYYYEYSHLMSDEQWYEWEGRILAGDKAEVDNPSNLPIERYTAGKYTIVDSLKTHPIAGYSCDSIRALVLQVGAVFRDTIYDATCANCGTYPWNIVSPITGRVTTINIKDVPQAGEQKVYYDSLKTVLGFDSIYVLYLTGYPSYEIQEDTTICQGEDLQWTGHMAGDNNWGHQLYFNGMPVTSIPTNRAGVFTVRDEMLTQEMIYTNPKTGEQKKIQCDSVHILTLRVCETYNHQYNTNKVMDYVGMKSNELLVHFGSMLFVGCDYDWQSSAQTKDELRAQYDTIIQLPNVDYWTDSIRGVSQCGCDSMHYVNIQICKLKTTTLTESIGDNNTTWRFGGNEVDANGRPIHSQPLITGEKFHYYDDGTPVDYSAAKDPTIREYNLVDTMLTANGCDSIVYATVWVYPTYQIIEKDTTCANHKYDWHGKYNLNELINQTTNPYQTVFTVYDSLTTHQGFDSIHILELAIIPSLLIRDTMHTCYNVPVEFYTDLVSYTGGQTADLIASFKDDNAPCGREHHRRVFFDPAYGYEGAKDYDKWVTIDSTCQYEDYRWLDANGNEHTQALRDSLGNKYTTIPTDKVGWITIYDSLKTVGCYCDSIHTLHLYVGAGFRQTDTLYACTNDTVQWSLKPDTFYTFNGEYDIYDALYGVAVNGCDSNYYLHVHFDQSYDLLTTIHLCTDDEHYQWEDLVFDSLIMASKQWDEPYQDSFVREYKTVLSGCDSIMRLDITIAPSHDSVWTDTICAGETYYFYDQELTESGEYVIDRPNGFGCYTHYYLTLVVIAPTQFDITPEPICVDEDGLANTYLIRYTYNGIFSPLTYSIRYDSIAQAIGFQSQENIPIPTDPNTMQPGQEYTIVLPVPEYANKQDYPRPGYYQAELAFENGVCGSDSLMTFPFEMVMRYPAWITQQHWNDAILIMDSTQNGGYVFSAYQWYKNGEILYGQTRPYLFEPEWLEDGAEYTVELTREDDNVTVMTCPLVPDLSGNYGNSPTQTYISVVPTIVAKESPIVYILSPTNGSYKLYNSQGQLVTQGDYTPNEYNAGQVELPSVSGVYVFHLVENTTMGTGNDLRRTVKVIVQ